MPIESTENDDARPLILTRGGRSSVRRQGLREAARLLRHASSGRRRMTTMMREPSMLVRESAAEQLEERQSDWAYSKPVVVLDFVWNLAFIAVAAAVLGLSSDEKPNTPLRVWTVGYGLQCVVHMVCVCVEYRRRSNRSPSKRLCIVFLGFDVFFVVLCIALACVIGIAVCCCLPCIIAVLYAVAEQLKMQEGASKEDIDQLTKFKFRKVGESEKHTVDEEDEQAKGDSGGVMTECGTDSPLQHTLPHEDAECCICLSAYADETELRELPCGHHFHCSCVDKWLYINATCPLCKYNILKNSNYEDGEEV
ncbi:hypothetical protein HID58_085456 [Brassica napus]|uniref:RING-type E3 ubiquitin transferase n=1 Tax=Brassica napus TaxID=3708 RepID=A0ABQ7XMN6_BRANA|nr:hypothetical protein HID58_085456 [Brassica napus]